MLVAGGVWIVGGGGGEGGVVIVGGGGGAGIVGVGDRSMEEGGRPASTPWT